MYYLVVTSDTKVVNSCNCPCDKEHGVLPDPLFMEASSVKGSKIVQRGQNLAGQLALSAPPILGHYGYVIPL